MKATSLRLSDYLGHIREAITRIERYTDSMDEQTFLNDMKRLFDRAMFNLAPVPPGR